MSRAARAAICVAGIAAGGFAAMAQAQTAANAQPPIVTYFEKSYRTSPPVPTTPPALRMIALGNPGAPDTAQWERHNGQLSLRNVTQPALFVMPAAPEKANGTAIIVAPGGGFIEEAFQGEGIDIAHDLNARGITVFILAYHLDPTPRDPREVGTAYGLRMASAHPTAAYNDYDWPTQDLAQADGLSAVTYVRAHAAELGVSPNRIGFMGFSAGALTAMNVATAYDASSRPNFVAPIYGAMKNRKVPADAPPLFIAVAADDPLFSFAGTPIYDSWHKAGRSAELHIYARGGHGFATGKPGTTTTHWLDDFYDWLSVEHFAGAEALRR